jgi:phosphoglycolate phosphatase
MRVAAGSVLFDVEAVVFDKDGTLISLESYWLEPSRRWVETAAAGSLEVMVALEERLGLLPDALDPEGPLATASLEDLVALTTDTLASIGVPAAAARSRAALARSRAKSLSASLSPVAIGDVRGGLQLLAAAGLRLAVATTDDEAPTLQALRWLGIDDLIDFVVAADGEIPPKPDRAVLKSIADRFGILPSSLLMVGDSQRDSDTARAGGAAGFVLVSPDGSSRIVADAVVTSVDEIQPTPPPAEP